MSSREVKVPENLDIIKQEIEARALWQKGLWALALAEYCAATGASLTESTETGYLLVTLGLGTAFCALRSHMTSTRLTETLTDELKKRATSQKPRVQERLQYFARFEQAT